MKIPRENEKMEYDSNIEKELRNSNLFIDKSRFSNDKDMAKFINDYLEHLPESDTIIDLGNYIFIKQSNNSPVKEDITENDQGLPTEDERLVMEQVEVSRQIAIKALAESNGDVVSAIMKLV